MTSPDSDRRVADLPVAVMRRGRRVSLAWLLPIAALLFCGFLVHRSWMARGVTISIRFADGQGLREGAELRYRGIAIGEVRRIQLTGSVDAVVAVVRLDPTATAFARAGARFFVVRPEIGLSGVRGMDTLLGPRYIAALPGAGGEQRAFDGLAEPVLVESSAPGDLELTLEAPDRGGLTAGAAIVYRDVRIGTVLGVALASDARSVEARCHIRAEFAPIVRTNSRFYNAGGVSADWGSRLLWMQLGGNLLRILAGGSVVLVTPDQPGQRVTDGHRFPLDAQPQDEWSAWQPSIPIGGDAHLPEAPVPLRAVLRWTEGRFLTTHAERRGFVLPVPGGLLGPLDLLVAPAVADPGSARLEVEGQPIALAATQRVGTGIAVLPCDPPSAGGLARSPLPAPTAPAECLVYLDRPAAPLCWAAHRLSVVAGGWRIDPSVAVAANWHGAAVVERASGRLIGVVLADRREIALVTVAPSVTPLGAGAAAEPMLEAADRDP